MSPFQRAFDRIGQVEVDLATVQVSLDERRKGASGSSLYQTEVARANSERTYLIRLLTEFEGALTDLGPHLRRPLRFTVNHGLADKLNGIGKNMGVDSGLRNRMQDDVLDLRNELAHGGLIPRVAFDDAAALIRQFLRWCS